MQRAEIVKAVMELPEDEREKLVEELDDLVLGGFATKEIEQAWAAEIERRCQEIDSGKAELLDWEEVREEILAELRARPR